MFGIGRMRNKITYLMAITDELSKKVRELEIVAERNATIIGLMMRHRETPLVTGIHHVYVDGKCCEVNFDQCELIYSFEYLKDELAYCTKIMGKHPEIVKISKLCVGYYKTPTGKFVCVQTNCEPDSKCDIEVVTEEVVKGAYFKSACGKQFIVDNAHYKRDTL